MASMATGATSPITEMALREYQANSQRQVARQKMFRSGYHRRPSSVRRLPPGSTMTLSDLLEHVAKAQKAADKRRKQLNTFNEMLKITDGYNH